MTFSPEVMLAEADRWAGFREGPNNQNPFSLWQYGHTNQPYCDSFVCYVAYLAGFRFPKYSGSGEKGDYNVTSHRLHAVRQGIWRLPTTLARPGWLVVLTFGIPDQHIEIVRSVDTGDRQIATIGGNTGNGVFYRVRDKANVVGYIALDEAGQGAGPTLPQPPEVIKQECIVFIRPNPQDDQWRPVAVQAINGALFVFNVTDNPFKEGKLRPFGNAHILDIKLTKGEVVQGLADRDQNGKLEPGHLIAATLLPNGELTRHDMHWKLDR